jgi:hypothetical protein
MPKTKTLFSGGQLKSFPRLLLQKGHIPGTGISSAHAFGCFLFRAAPGKMGYEP